MFRTHRQRVPAMLVVACVGMMVYAVAGAAPDDGQTLAPAEATVPAAKSSSAPTDDCKEPTTSTTRGSTSTTRDGDGKDGGSTSTTRDGDGKDGGSTSTTRDGDGKNGSTPTTTDKDVSTAAAVKGGSTTATTEKGDSASSGNNDCETTSTTRRDRDTTSTTDNDGDGKTTSTTRKGGKGTTTTTDRKDRPTTSTTERQQTVEPTTPSGGDPGSDGSDSGGATDPGATPIEPQEAPPEASDSDAGPVDESEEWVDDPGVEDDGGWYDVPDEGPVDFGEDEVAFMASPGAPEPVLPTFGFSSGKSNAPTNRPNRSSGRTQELTAPPLVMSSSGSVQASSGLTESQAVSRRLAGLQTSVTESAFPASVISTPKIFPINRRDPLAAAALVLLVGVSRELFKVWRRRASDYWPA